MPSLKAMGQPFVQVNMWRLSLGTRPWEVELVGSHPTDEASAPDLMYMQHLLYVDDVM